MRRNMKLPLNSKIFAFLPGSRQSEVHYMADTFILTAKEIRKKWVDARFLVPLATRETRNLFEEALYRNQATDAGFTLLFGHAVDAMIAKSVDFPQRGSGEITARRGVNSNRW